MNGYTTPQEYIAQAEACLATAKEELAKARAAQAQARVWIALIETALNTWELTNVTEPGNSRHTLGDFSVDENGVKVYNVTEECDFHEGDSRDPLACTCDESTI
jgi:hypothetical protein